MKRTRVKNWIAPALLVLLGAITIVIALASFFFHLEYVRPAQSGQLKQYEIMLGELRVVQTGYRDPLEAQRRESRGATNARTDSGFRIQPSDLPGQLRQQFLIESFLPFSAQGATFRAIDFSNNSVLLGSGWKMKLLHVGSLAILCGLIWIYIRRLLPSGCQNRPQ